MADAPPAPPSRGTQGPPRGDGAAADPALQARAQVASRRVNRFGLIAIASLVAGSLPLPWAIAGLPFGLLALVFGVMALVASLDARVRGGAIALLSVSLVVVTLLVLAQLVQVVVYPVTFANQECRSQALTEAALAACEEQLPGGGAGFPFGEG